MSDVIWKYPITSDHMEIGVPDAGWRPEVVHIGFDPTGQACVWIRHPNPGDRPPAKQYMVGLVVTVTGSPFDHNWETVGSFISGEYVYHVLRVDR